MTFPLSEPYKGSSASLPLSPDLGGDQAQEERAAKVVDIAQRVTGTLDPMEAIHRLQNNTDMVSELQKAIIQVEAEIELAIMRDR